MEEQHIGHFGGVRISTLNAVLMGLSVLFAVGLVITGGLVLKTNGDFRDSVDRYIVCEQAAADFKAASDYLTMQSRLFVTTGDVRYMDNYFDEEDGTRRRERAREVIAGLLVDDGARRYFDQALSESDDLTNREHYAMKLAAQGFEVDSAVEQEHLSSVEVAGNDSQLSAEQKKEAARDLLFGDAYQNAKDSIDARVAECTDELIQATQEEEARATEHLEGWLRQQTIMVIVLVLTLLGSIVSVWLLVLRPLASYTKAIRNNEKFEVAGAKELRFTAEAYNAMYVEARHHENNLIRQAEHDGLTGLLNRSAFERFYDEAASHCALLLCDLDSFKDVNDSYGHDVGDDTLRRLAEVLPKNFRTTDRSFRLGGDEFAVIMCDASSDIRATVEAKYRAIRSSLVEEGRGVPPFTISVGVAFSDELADGVSLYKAADLALYRAKENGRDGIFFYADLD